MKIKYRGPYVWPKGHYNDAGHDVINPYDIEIRPHESVAINTEMTVFLPDGTMGIMMPRSSLSKMGLICNMSPIDAGYRGKVHVLMTNNSNECIELVAGQKICNFVVVPIIDCDLVRNLGNERGSDAFGSTGL